MDRQAGKAGELALLKKSLSRRELETIRRECPYRVQRNRLIRRLYLNGVKLPLLAALSGLGKSTIHRIGTGRIKDERLNLIKEGDNA